MSEVLDAPTALAIITPAQMPTLLASDTADILGKLRAELAGYTPDASTPAGRTEARSKAKKVGAAKMDFKRLKDSLLEDAKKKVSSVNAEFKIVETNCDEIRDAILEPVEAYDAIEKERVAELQAAFDAIDAATYVEPGASAETIQATLDAFNARPARQWAEFATRARQAIEAGTKHLEGCLVFAIQREAEAAELEALRAAKAEREAEDARRAQAERERQIAAQAAEKARLDAEEAASRALCEERTRAAREAEAAAKVLADAEAKAARDAEDARLALQQEQDRAAKAEADRIVAIAKAEQDARDIAARVEANRIATEQKAEADRIAAVTAEQKRAADAKAAEDAIAEKRAANVAHRKRINNEALDALVKLGLDREIAVTVLTACVKGEIPHLSIGY